MDDTRIVNKIKKVLNELTKPNFRPKSDVYLTSLLTYLTSESDYGPLSSQNVVFEQLLLPWFREAVTEWESFAEYPNFQVSKFTLSLLTWLCGKKETFTIIDTNHFFERLFSVACKVPHPELDKINDEILKLLLSILDHESGLNWFAYSKYWKMILEKSWQTRVIWKRAVKIIAKLIINSDSYDLSHCEVVVQTMLSPLIQASNKVVEIENGKYIINGTPHEYCFPDLNLLIEILNELLAHQMATDNKSIFRLITEQQVIEKCVYELLKANLNDNIRYDLYRILIILSLSEMYGKLAYKLEIHQGQEDFPNKLFEVLGEISSKVSMNNALKLLDISIEVYNIMEPKLPKIINSNSTKIFIGCLLMSLVIHSSTIYGIEPLTEILLTNFKDTDDNRNNFFKMAMGYIVIESWKISQKWSFFSYSNYFLSPGTQCLEHISKMKHIYNRHQGIYVCKIFISSFRDISLITKSSSDIYTHFFNQSEYLAHLIQCIAEFIEHFSITWRDIVDTFDILENIYDFLYNLDWPKNIILKALYLVNIAISKHLSPPMALLMDELDNYSLKPFVPMLRTYLETSDWEIKESSINIIRTISAKIDKFPTFRNIVLEYDFPRWVLELAAEDKHPPIRVASLKCLQEMIQIKGFGSLLIEKYDALGVAVNILKIDIVGTVRAETVILCNLIYQSYHLTKDNLLVLYQLMRNLAMADLELEVRQNSLDFWKSVIDRHLTQSGMVDGSFPDVIFSTKLRKIVNLTETKIKKLLVEVLHQLASIECLTVFQIALQDRLNPNVIEHAKCAITDFVMIIKRYKISLADLTPIRKAESANYNLHDPETIRFFSEDEGDVRMDLTKNTFHRTFDPSHASGLNRSEKFVSSIKLLEQVQTLLTIEFEDNSENQEKQRNKWDDFEALLDDILCSDNGGSGSNMDTF